MRTLKHILLLCGLLLSTTALAQSITRVSGTVADDIDVLPGVNIVEIDGSNRMVNATVTDMNGNFVLPIKSAKNKLKISYIGYQTQILPINKSVYKVVLKDQARQLGTVTVKATKKLQTSGLAIPEREVSFAAQAISAKEFEGLGITSVDEALQGRIAGLDIIANSGDLGSGTTMRLRGASTISTLTSSEPLIVVNGNVWNVDQTDFDVSTANEEKFAQLLNVNTEDIEDIKVLKDASATAIWGSQGANGVIEIKTKRGHRGPTRVDYSLKLTGTYQPAGIKLLNGDQYTMLLKESYFNPEQNDHASDIPELNYEDTFSEWRMFNNNTDWVDEVTQFGLRQNHYVSLTGGDEKTLFRISGGYDHETGSIIKQKLQRFSTRMALDYYVNDRIKIVSNFSLTYTDNDRNYENLLGIAYKKMPNLAVYEEPVDGQPNGQYYYMLQSASEQFKDDQKVYGNPVAIANLAKDKYRTYDITPELQLEYKLLGTDDNRTQLNYKGRVVMNIFNAYTDRDYPRELSTLNYFNTHNVNSSSTKSLAFTTQHELTFIPKFSNEDHSLMAMGRFQLVSGSSSAQSTDANRLPNGLSSPSAGAMITGMSSSYSQWRSLYYLFSAHYSYKSKYSIDGSVRADATTKFGPSNPWGVFYGVGGRWNISDEPWMKWAREKLKVSMLAVRPGYGVVGNQPNANFLYLNTYGLGQKYMGVTSVHPNGLKLTDLRWEKIYSWNLGFDLWLFDNRLKLNLDLYDKRTKDMLMGNMGIVGYYGFSSLAYKNVGDLKNTGWEFFIEGSDLLKIGKFKMDVNVTFADNTNVITKMDPGILNSLNTDFVEENRATLQRVQINNSFGSIYGFRYKGVYQYNYETYGEMVKDGKSVAGKTFPVATNAKGEVIKDDKGDPVQMRFCYKMGSSSAYRFQGGDAIYEDVNHDGNINQLDIVYLGNSLPKLTGGFGFRFHYDRWALNAQFNYRIDYDILNMARLDMESMISNNNQSQAVNYRWRKEGDGANGEPVIPRAMYGNKSNYNTLISDRFIEDGTFLRLNYLQLSYNFDTKKIKKFGLNRLNFYVTANNLFCLTKYTGVDPEIGYGGFGITTDNSRTPRSKSYTLGVTVGF